MKDISDLMWWLWVLDHDLTMLASPGVRRAARRDLIAHDRVRIVECIKRIRGLATECQK